MLCWHATRAPLNSKPIIVSSGSAQIADRLTFLKAEVSQERDVAAGVSPLCSHIHVPRFCLTRLEPQQGAAATPGPCAALYDILNYSTEEIDIPTDAETPRTRLQTLNRDNVCSRSPHAFTPRQSINVMYVRGQPVSWLSL